MSDSTNILVVDDDHGWRETLAEALSDEGRYNVVESADLLSARRALDLQYFHLAVVDIRLDEANPRNVDGLTVLQRIWELDEGTAAMVLSGYATADMFSSFREYGVFDFAEKATDPLAIAEQYRAAEFIKRTIDKSDPPDKILEWMTLGLVEAQRAYIQRRWQTSPFHILRGLSGRDVQHRLGGAGMVELRPFLGELVRPLYPWLRAGVESTAISETNDHPGTVYAYETLIWSRMLAKPVIVRFGRKEHFEHALDLAPPGSCCSNARIVDELARESSQHFTGVLYLLADVPFDDHFSPPASRRVTRSSASPD